MKFNQKNIAIALMVVGAISVGSALGASTSAKFSKSMYEKTGSITSAKFNINSTMKGNVDKVTIEGHNLHPGTTAQLTSFDVNKEGTQVPVEYTLTLKPEGDLFKDGTPITLVAHRAVDGDVKEKIDLQFVDGKYQAESLVPLSDNDTFIIDWQWPFESGKNDNEFSGKTGQVLVQIDAVQVKK